MNYRRLIVALVASITCFSSFSQTVFRPADLAGLNLWLRADSGVVANTDSVQQWMDQSSNKDDARQATGANQPLLIPSVSTLNNMPVIRFDGVDDELRMDSTLITGTAFILANWAGASPFPKYNGMITVSAASPQPNYVFMASANSTSLYTSASETSFGSTLYKNGVASTNFLPLADYKIISGNDLNLHSFNSLTLGNNPVDFGNNHWNGDIAEIIIYDNVLADSNRTKVEQYLKDKYAPPVNLGPDITFSNTFCDTVITAPSYFTSYLWSTGATTQQITVSSSGTYWVKVTSIFGDNSSDTIVVNLNRPAGYDFKDSSFCKGGYITWNTNLPKSLFSFTWSDGSSDSLLNISAVGDYYVTISDSYGCSQNSDTIHAAMDAYRDSISLGPDTSMCAGNTIHLKAGAAQTVSYLWNDNSSAPSLAINSSGQYSVITQNSNGCTGFDTILVTIAGQAPVADFSFSNGCIGLPIQFIDMSVPPSGNSITSWQWVFGDPASGTNDTTGFPGMVVHTFSDTGSFAVNLSILTNAGCGQVKTYIVHVSPQPTINFSSGISCQSDTTFFTPSILTYGYPVSSYWWNFGDAATTTDTSTQALPHYVYSSATTYTATLVATNSSGCSDTITKTINVQQEVLADFTYTNTCTNTAVQFNDNSIAPLPVSQHPHLWNFNGSAGSGLTPTHLFNTAGVYPVTLTVNGTNGCVSSVTKMVQVYYAPAVQFFPTNFCKNDSIYLNDQSVANNGSIITWNWSFDNTLFSTSPNTLLNSGISGAHTIKLAVTNSFGCKDSITKNITVYALPAVNFTTNPPVYIYPLQPVVLIPNHSNGSVYNWSSSSGFTSALVSPSVAFPDTGVYAVTLVYADSNNCRGSKVNTITVLPRYTDLAIIDLVTTLQPDNYCAVSATLVNAGTVAISNFDIQLSIPNSATAKETWTGTLNPGTAFTYTFQSQPFVINPGNSEFACADIKTVNGSPDAYRGNNDFCAAVNTETGLYSLFPNPAVDHITLPFVTDKARKIGIEIYDHTGKLVMDEEASLQNQGLNLLRIPVLQLEKGMYVVKINMDNKTYKQRFIKD